MGAVSKLIRDARASPRVNPLLTGPARALLDAAGGLRPEWIVKHVHRAGRTEVRLPNGHVLALWSRADDWISTQLFWRGMAGYEPETTTLFFELASRSRRTLDVGAYVGYFALLAAHANPGGQVIAFEPVPAMFERLERNVRENGLQNVECVRAAVGREPGEVDLWTGPASTLLPSSVSLSRQFMVGSGGEVRPLRVTCVTLDEHLAGRGPIDLVKIDTETTEPDVLAGMRRILDEHRPTIVCEVLDRADGPALERILGPFGYRYFLLTPGGPVRQDRIVGHPEWLNYLLTTTDPEALLRR